MSTTAEQVRNQARCPTCGAFRPRLSLPSASAPPGPPPRWTYAQVDDLNRAQATAERPLTCHKHPDIPMYATPHGWMCAKPRCRVRSTTDRTP